MADNSDSTVFSSGWKCLNLTFEDGSTSTASVEAIVYRSIITDKDPQAIQRLQEVWTEIHGNQTIVQIAAEENENQQCNIADTESQAETSDTEMPVVDESKDGINWKHEGVLLLISLYEAHKEKFASSAISKKAVWNMIATKMKDQGYSVTGHQCSEKFKSLKNRYKDNRKKMAKSGRGRVTWRYYDIMEELLAGDPAVEPLKVVASANCAKDPAAKPPLPPNAKRTQISSPSANAVAIRAASPTVAVRSTSPTVSVRSPSPSSSNAGSPAPDETVPDTISHTPVVKRRRKSGDVPEWFRTFANDTARRMDALEASSERMIKIAEERNDILRTLVDVLTKN